MGLVVLSGLGGIENGNWLSTALGDWSQGHEADGGIYSGNCRVLKAVKGISEPAFSTGRRTMG